MSIIESFRLGGRVALITGAGKGIGEGIALGMAEAGADVALVSRTAADLDRVAERVRALGRKAFVLPADLAQIEALPDLVAKVLSAYPRIDILVNCAGIQRRMTVLDATVEGWNEVMNTNLRSVYFLTQAVGKGMVAQRYGKIVSIASMTTYRGFHMISPYGISKAGLANFTRYLAVEWAPYNVRANAIAPGWITTPMTQQQMGKDRVRWVCEHVPQGKFGTPRDVAGLAVYLASPASDYITGQTIPIDGGFLAGNPWPTA
ncbi:MAG TPA: glucose 1-dehydrogenase [Candidatus Baltobacteraceae bacterium]|nr:glucose 1-dehydrogenase [Candidatus Baltobacteraceae bacterium]